MLATGGRHSMCAGIQERKPTRMKEHSSIMLGPATLLLRNDYDMIHLELPRGEVVALYINIIL